MQQQRLQLFSAHQPEPALPPAEHTLSPRRLLQASGGRQPSESRNAENTAEFDKTRRADARSPEVRGSETFVRQSLAERARKGAQSVLHRTSNRLSCSCESGCAPPPSSIPLSPVA